MNEKIPQQPEEELMLGVREALETGKVGFEDISVEGAEQLFTIAPEGQLFFVPDERYRTVYGSRASAMGRSDIKFEVA